MPNGELVVTLETDRRTIMRPIIPYKTLETWPLTRALEGMSKNHAAATDKVIARQTVPITKEEHRFEFIIPDRPGAYYLKIFARGDQRSLVASKQIRVVQHSTH